MTILYKEKSGGNARLRRIVPTIPLERPEKKESRKGEHTTCKLRSDPTEATSATHDLSVPCFSAGSPEEWFKFVDNLKKIITGQNIADAADRHALCGRLLDGDALTSFEAKATELGPTNLENFDLCLKAVTDSVLPARAVIMQKRYLRRVARKPRSWKTRDWIARAHEINNRIPHMDPNAEKLPDDEIKEIAEFGIPNSFQNEMIRQQFDPIDRSMQEFILFCERQELLEATTSDGDSKSKPKVDKSRSSKRPRSSADTEKHCVLHGKCSHSTDECTMVMHQIKKLKRKSESSSQKSTSGGMTKEEIHAIIETAANRKLKKKKDCERKRETSEELDAFEELSVSNSEGEADEQESAHAVDADDSAEENESVASTDS